MNTEIPIYCNGKYSLVEETLNLGICVLLFYHFFLQKWQTPFNQEYDSDKNRFDVSLTFS